MRTKGLAVSSWFIRAPKWWNIRVSYHTAGSFHSEQSLVLKNQSSSKLLTTRELYLTGWKPTKMLTLLIFAEVDVLFDYLFNLLKPFEMFFFCHVGVAPTQTFYSYCVCWLVLLLQIWAMFRRFAWHQKRPKIFFWTVLKLFTSGQLAFKT
jgi:hypothetical protein